jgi:hypothetical protein
MTGLTKEQAHSIKKSYLNILGLFLSEEKIESRYLRCLLKWGFQLQLSPEDLRQENIDISHLKFSHPAEKLEKAEAVYHLVHMICLDKVVEDVELEVASVYARKLGFKPALVSDLLKAIVTEDFDGNDHGTVRQQVIDFLKLNDA